MECRGKCTQYFTCNFVVYRIEMFPADFTGKEADFSSTTVFEIDKTVPVVSARNGRTVDAGDIAFLDIYTYDRKDEPAPTIVFFGCGA